MLYYNNTLHQINARFPIVGNWNIINNVDVAGDWLRITGNPDGMHIAGEDAVNTLYFTDIPLKLDLLPMLGRINFWKDEYTNECLAARYGIMPLYGSAPIVAPNEASLLELLPFTENADNRALIPKSPSARVINSKFQGSTFSYLCISQSKLLIVTNLWNSSTRCINISNYINNTSLSINRPQRRRDEFSALKNIQNQFSAGPGTYSELSYYSNGILIYNYMHDLLLYISENNIESYQLENTLNTISTFHNATIFENCITSNRDNICIGIKRKHDNNYIDIILCHGSKQSILANCKIVGRIKCNVNSDVRIGLSSNILVFEETPEASLVPTIRMFKLPKI